MNRQEALELIGQVLSHIEIEITEKKLESENDLDRGLLEGNLRNLERLRRYILENLK